MKNVRVGGKTESLGKRSGGGERDDCRRVEGERVAKGLVGMRSRVGWSHPGTNPYRWWPIKTRRVWGGKQPEAWGKGVRKRGGSFDLGSPTQRIQKKRGTRLSGNLCQNEKNKSR